ncbi:MAG: T9SS type A sorting domain-containing protein [Gemmatimonadetes bacterium]|nr:T9SS type A sorting domain-containing protein [Gemmatimonadota bacterium]
MMNRALDLCRKALTAVPALLLVAGPAAAQHTFDGNITIVFENGGPNYKLDASANSPACSTLINTVQNSPNNDNFNSIPAGFWGGNAPKWPNQTWQPSATSIASGDIDNVSTVAHVVPDSCDACGYTRNFEQACFRGAIDPNGTDWTQGWLCSGETDQCLPDLTGIPIAFHSGAQTTSQTWGPDSVHVLQGKVEFNAGTTITILPGTVILGEKVSGPSFLSVAVGAMIDAQGTAAQPIIMTSDQVTGTPGDWAGLVLNGDATANCADCRGDNGPPAQCNSEGDPSLLFCGSDDCDSSGILRYVRVQYSGFILGANNELNSFTFNGQGSGTVAEYLQAHRGSDDMFEWFGGAMNARYLVGTGGQDDGLDFQAGFRGTVQYAVIQHFEGDRGIEGDNWEGDSDAPCRSNPLMANLTLIGGLNGGGGDSGVLLRLGAEAQIFNSIVYDWPDANYELRNTETCARGANPYPATFPCGNRVDAPVIAAGARDGVSVRTIPNPVTSSAQFALSLNHEGPTRLDVFDIQGRLVANVVNEYMTPGAHTVSWTPGTDVAPGAYFYRLQNGGAPVNGKFVVVR